MLHLTQNIKWQVVIDMGRERFGLGFLEPKVIGGLGDEEIYKDVLPFILDARKASIFGNSGVVFLRAAVSAYDMVNTSSFGLDGVTIMKDSEALPEEDEDYKNIVLMAERQAMVESRIGKEWTQDA